jgi:putative peptidoglycan lipid II flippase
MSVDPEALAVTASSDSVRSIRRSSINFFSGTMLSRVSGMVRDIVLAFCFGTHEALAAFFVAFRLAHLARRLFGEGAFQSAFIPLFEEIRKQSHVQGCRFFRDLSILWALLLIIACCLLATALTTWRHLVLPEGGVAEILALTAIMLPGLIPTCLFGLNISFLQCQKQYFTAGVAPVFFNIVLIGTAILFSEGSPKEIMTLLSVGVVIACCAQWAASFPQVFWQCKAVLGNQLFSGISLRSPEIKRLWHPLTLGLLGIGASQINNAIDALFARAADPEGPAQLWFSIRFQQLPLALFGIAVANAILPPLSRAIQAHDTARYHQFLEYGLKKVLALLAPCTGLLMLCGMAMINCIYGHGGFQAHSVISTAGCLQGYALALVPTGLILVLAPAFYAKGNYTIPMRGACLSLALNTVLNTILVFGFGWKAISVTVATSISAWVNATYLFLNLQKELGPLLSKEGAISCARTCMASLAASAAVFTAITLWLSPPVFFHALDPSTTVLPRDLLQQGIHLVVPMGLFGLCLFLFAKIFKAQDILAIVK